MNKSLMNNVVLLLLTAASSLNLYAADKKTVSIAGGGVVLGAIVGVVGWQGWTWMQKKKLCKECIDDVERYSGEITSDSRYQISPSRLYAMGQRVDECIQCVDQATLTKALNLKADVNELLVKHDEVEQMRLFDAIVDLSTIKKIQEAQEKIRALPKAVKEKISSSIENLKMRMNTAEISINDEAERDAFNKLEKAYGHQIKHLKDAQKLRASIQEDYGSRITPITDFCVLLSNEVERLSSNNQKIVSEAVRNERQKLHENLLAILRLAHLSFPTDFSNERSAEQKYKKDTYEIEALRIQKESHSEALLFTKKAQESLSSFKSNVHEALETVELQVKATAAKVEKQCAEMTLNVNSKLAAIAEIKSAVGSIQAHQKEINEKSNAATKINAKTLEILQKIEAENNAAKRQHEEQMRWQNATYAAPVPSAPPFGV